MTFPARANNSHSSSCTIGNPAISHKTDIRRHCRLVRRVFGFARALASRNIVSESPLRLHFDFRSVTCSLNHYIFRSCSLKLGWLLAPEQELRHDHLLFQVMKATARKMTPSYAPPVTQKSKPIPATHTARTIAKSGEGDGFGRGNFCGKSPSGRSPIAALTRIRSATPSCGEAELE